MDKNKFIEKVWIVAKEGYERYGILPSLTISQSILESDWGKKHIQNNIFGIKAGSSWNGAFATRMTREWDGSKYITVEARFRAYDSFEDSIRDYLKLIGESKRYERVKEAKDYKEASRLIYEAGYATDPKYSQKLVEIIEGYGLYKYDKKVMENPISPWAAEAMVWGTKLGITDGQNPKEFATREQVITMMYRYHKGNE